MTRVLFAVDVQNLFFACRDTYNITARVDYRKLLDLATHGFGTDNVIARAYMVAKRGHDDSGFIRALERVGYTVRKRVIEQDGSDWDVGIVTETMRDAEDFDVFVLASGDGDFVELIMQLQAREKYARVLSLETGLSEKLRAIADEVVVLDNVDCLWKGGANGRKTKIST